ncbi:DNA cytosine methyltransferase [Agrobacterium tumefaciens]|nr:DNA cytosine methyltransferase [Agrobacterium tumefaciens]TQN55382.1 DNA cytosine methyltransferase [Agrobacterium tumefaciens]
MASDSKLIRLEKLTRLQMGGKARTLEICSGAGGLSLGMLKAGFDLSAHIEFDPEAAESYAHNFGVSGHGSAWARPRDMVDTTAAQLVAELEFKTSAAGSFDVLAAGLPCQAFARIGRSKLRSVAGEEDAFQKDPRASLYRHFLQFVEDTQPLAIIIENVPDILNFGGHNVPEEICETLEQSGYRARYTILNAAYFGVPQVRERLFIVALADVLDQVPEFPAPTHFLDLPRGYEGSRRVALKHVSASSRYFHPIPVPEATLPPAVGTRDAIGDLPVITEHFRDPAIIRRRKLTADLPYQTKPGALSDYAQLMRNWSGFATSGSSDAHLVRLTPRDFPIFSRMAVGDDYPVARRIAEKILAETLAEAGLADLGEESQRYLEIRSKIVPPYDPAKFPNKWWKLDPDKPSRTLTAHMGKDTYSHIHYDSGQRRTVSVREAARLQSFPDGFQFAGAMNAAFRQIGNAVPPLLGYAVARTLLAQLGCQISRPVIEKKVARRRAA